jgi:hypothetical protein
LSETIPGFGPGGACGDQIRSRRICRTQQPFGLPGFSTIALQSGKKYAPLRGHICCVAEREGFEPSMGY